MYQIPQMFNTLVQNLSNRAGSVANARLLVQVELTLFLAEQLGLESEPLAVGWVLLSRMPLHHRLLQHLTPEQRRMHAIAAVLVPLSARFAWDKALAQYAKLIPSTLGLYSVKASEFNSQSIEMARQYPCPDPERMVEYHKLLTTALKIARRNIHQVESDHTYRVQVRDNNGTTQHGRVTITEEMLPLAPLPTWFDGNPRPRTVISVSLDDLRPTAIALDDWERTHKGRVHWEDDLDLIRYRRAHLVEKKLELGQENSELLVLEGAVHLPGMVSSGKTTLAKLIIAHCLIDNIDVRITFVVGDSSSSIQTADQINRWFLNDADGEEVNAVPLAGRSQQAVHLERLLASNGYAKSIEEKRAHWGERWLNPVCPLAAHIRWEGESDTLIAPGAEPCEGLMDEPSKRRAKRHLCPFFHACPSKQVYRDMPHARIWVTTPGALAQAAPPLHLEQRAITIGDLVYEQSDLVIFDEVETIVEWFDRTFAKREILTNGRDGLLDRLDTQISAFWTANRVLSDPDRRWVVAVRDSIEAVSRVLTIIRDPREEKRIQAWVKRGYFSPNALAYRLARRIAGLKEWDLPEKLAEQEARIQPVYAPFNELLNDFIDPLRRVSQSGSTPAVQAADELAQILQIMNNLSDDPDDTIHRACLTWLNAHFPELASDLKVLKRTLLASPDKHEVRYAKKELDESVEDVAHRLRFLIAVVLLDRHMQIFLREWHNKPDSLEVAEPFRQIPRGLRDLLPTPLIGGQFGFVIDTVDGKGTAEARNHLSLFAYTNIGRSYLLDYPHLRQDVEGQPGPHMLALSGTSYLPDSTTFHVTLPPAGILLAPDATEDALKASRFIFKHFEDSSGAIKVSGEPDKTHQLRRLATAMLSDGGYRGGYFFQVLRMLRDRMQGKDGDKWMDRDRLLIFTNSYPQAETFANVLRQEWSEYAEAVYHLKRGRDKEDYQVGSSLLTIDIEQFARTNGRILVAPMQAVGRGFNILTKDGKAAFGAVMFLTRPMSHPRDMEATAQELNRFALEWAQTSDMDMWNFDTLYKRALKAREAAMLLRRKIEQRHGYTHLGKDPALRLDPRRDLAATTAGRIVQAVGRLIRGSVPFYAYFIDAAWSPNLATGNVEPPRESAETSLLTAMIEVMAEYAGRDAVGAHLYTGFADALACTEGIEPNL